MRSAKEAFTLVEMLVVIAIIGILSAILLPVLARSKQKTQGTFCLNNGKQMMIAMVMYGNDFTDFFPPNPDDGNTNAGHNWCPGRSGVGGDAEFNPDILKDPTLSLLISYLSGNVSVFHCPGDLRIGEYQGTDPTWIGKSVPAARTFSMSQAVGTICPGYDNEKQPKRPRGPHSGVPNLPVNGPWLNNKRTNRREAPWITYGKFSEIAMPGPSQLWVLVDEGVNGLNDAAFAFGMQTPVWIDAPGTYHEGGCGFAFADGHSESHHWQSTAEKIGEQGGNSTPVANEGDLQDWLWMRVRTSAYFNGVMPPPD